MKIKSISLVAGMAFALIVASSLTSCVIPLLALTDDYVEDGSNNSESSASHHSRQQESGVQKVEDDVKSEAHKVKEAVTKD